jgi:hypothetical protein
MDPKSRHNYRTGGKLQSTEVPVIILQENAAEKPLEIYSFSLMEKEICRRRHEAESRRGGPFARA